MPFPISFTHITLTRRYEVPHRLKKGVKKTLLDDISGLVRPGQVGRKGVD